MVIDIKSNSTDNPRRNAGQQHGRAFRVLVISLSTILGVAVLLTAYFFMKLEQTRSGAVAIVATTTSATSPSQAAATTVPPTETTLPPIAGEPTDLDVDYDVPVENPTVDPIYQKVPLKANVFNIVLMSSDARPGEKVGRSDSMMVASFDRDAKSIKLASFMRDSWVPIPGHGWNRINAAYAYGGVGLAVNTLNDNFGLDIQNYVTLRFEQFITIIDKLGGVSLKLSKAETDYINRAYSGKDLASSSGVMQLNGAQALIHCRNRKVGNGDFDRTRRQRETMFAILQKMKQQRNPITLASLISFALDNVGTNMNANELFTLAMEAVNADKLSFDQTYVPFPKTWHYANENGRSVISIDIARNKTLLHDFLYPDG